MNIFHNAKITLAICTPMPYVKGTTGQLIHESISPLWHRARMGLAIPTNINMIELFVDGLEVGDARSRIAAQCLAHNPQPEFLLFLDYDVLLPYDSLTKLFYRARCYPEYDIFAGVYCTKWMNPPEPLIYGENGTGAIWNWTVGDLLTTESHGVKSVHMGLTLIRTSLFKKLLDAKLVNGDGTVQDDNPFFLSINDQCQNNEGVKLLRRGTEDIYFCSLAAKINTKIMVDTGVLAGHHDKGSGITYGLPTDGGPAQRAKWLHNKDRLHQDRVDADAQIYEGPCDCIKNVAVDELPLNHIRLDDNTICLSDCEDCKGTGQVKRPYKLAIDLGAGGERRKWPGYITYTTDIRKDSGPDYVQDTRELTLPINHYDKVACMAEGSLVITKIGIKRIEEIVVGDEVWTHKNRWCAVMANNKYVPPELFRIITAGHPRGFFVSSNHPILVRHLQSSYYNKSLYQKIASEVHKFEFVKADEITRYHLAVGMIPMHIEHRDVIDLATILPINQEIHDYAEIIERRGNAQPGTEGSTKLAEEYDRTKTQIRGWIYYDKAPFGYHCGENEIYFHSSADHSSINYDVKIPRYVSLDGDLMRLIGYYLSDGSLSTKHGPHIGFHFHIKEQEYCDDVQNIIADKFGFVPTDIRTKANCTTIRYCSRTLHDIIINLIGKGKAHEKKIPTWALWETSELQQQLLEGILRGDGCIASNNCHSITTVSETLAEGLRILLLRLGEMPSICKYTQDHDSKNRFRSCGWRFEVKWTPKRHNQVGGLVYDDIFVSRVWSVEKINNNIIPVYGLEVKEDESYFAGGVTQHNSSHHLEHIGRWDQEQVWSQIYKICKPGGKIEMIVPSIQWAAAKIMNGEVDEHVMNVLYGAQEAHSYQREFNTHYFGYTPEVAVNLAETAGFVDVRTQDWQQIPELGYNMLITGKKPLVDKNDMNTTSDQLKEVQSDKDCIIEACEVITSVSS